ncbi:HET-domain-containing protein, partial [Aulographum hederae CBS 113979]
MINIFPHDPLTFSAYEITLWLENCQSRHKDTCHRIDRVRNHGGEGDFFVINVDDMRIDSVPRTSEYIALSYVWGKSQSDHIEEFCLRKSNLERLRTPNALSREDLPATVADTISLVKLLGYSYLWIDRLCIIQDDDAERMRHQLDAMGETYSGSVFTIAAVAGDDAHFGLPGVPGSSKTRLTTAFTESPVPVFETLIDDSIWNCRAWTYQERMCSRRCLYITNNKLFFQC